MPDIDYKVPNLERGLAILELLSSRNGGLTIQEIKTELNLSQTTVFRITQSLLGKGYLTRDDESKKFFLTRKMLSIGFGAINESDLLEIAIPYMKELRDEQKETVFLGIIGDDKGIFIEQILGTYPFKFMLTPGNEFHYHCSAPGKAIMACLPESEREQRLKNLKYVKHNDNTITSKRQYKKELNKVSSLGYALDKEEQLKGVICIGAPILDYKNYPVASIWISGPSDRLPEDSWDEKGKLVKEYAEKISQKMGYNN